MTRWQKWMMENDLNRGEIICRLTDNCFDCPLHMCSKAKGNSGITDRFLDEEVAEDEDQGTAGSH